jgi:hypothetical protein
MAPVLAGAFCVFSVDIATVFSQQRILEVIARRIGEAWTLATALCNWRQEEPNCDDVARL